MSLRFSSSRSLALPSNLTLPSASQVTALYTRSPRLLRLLGLYALFTCGRTVLQRLFFSKSLTRRLAIVTGAGSGIGRLLAIQLAVKEGMLVACWDLNESSAKETADMINGQCAAGGAPKARAYNCDVSNYDAVVSAHAATVKDFAGQAVYLLVNNAGIVSGKSLLDVPPSLAQKTMDVNVSAHFWTTKACLPGMIARKEGHVVTVASAAGLVGVAGLCDYCASKYGARGFNEALRLELLKNGAGINAIGLWPDRGVATTSICPYYIATGMFEGVSCPFPVSLLLPILKPDYVVGMMVRAIKTNVDEMRLPNILYWVELLHVALPIWLKDRIFGIVGITSSMDHFTQTRKH